LSSIEKEIVRLKNNQQADEINLYSLSGGGNEVSGSSIRSSGDLEGERHKSKKEKKEKKEKKHKKDEKHSKKHKKDMHVK